MVATVTMAEAAVPGLDGYAEISKPEAVVILSTKASLRECQSKCNLEVHCKGIKYTDGRTVGEGECTLLAAPSARDGVKAIEAATKAQEAQVQKAAQAKVEALKELQTKSAVREKDVKKAQAEARTSNKEVHIVLNPIHQQPVPTELNPTESLIAAQLKAERMIKQIKAQKSGKPKVVPVLQQKLVREVLEAAEEASVCEFANKLHDKYVKRVEQEVEHDEEEQPGDAVKLLRKETKRMNRIVQRRAEREARRKMRMTGMKIEANVRGMLSEKNGQQKAQEYLKRLQNKHCPPKKYEIKEAEVPQIKHVDSWKNCFEQKENCKISSDVRKYCAKTCHEAAN